MLGMCDQVLEERIGLAGPPTFMEESLALVLNLEATQRVDAQPWPRHRDSEADPSQPESGSQR